MRSLAAALLALLILPSAAQAVAGPENATRLVSEVARAGVWGNTHEYTPPIYQAGTLDKPVVVQQVHDRLGRAYLNDYWRAVPVPTDFAASPGTDGEAVIVNRTGGGLSYFEFYDTDKDYPGFPGWSARFGGAANSTELPNNIAGHTWPINRGVQGSGYTFLPGVVTVQDLRNGVIQHPVHLLVPYSCPTWHAPANRTDAVSKANPADPRCIEYGTVFKLPPSYVPPSTMHPVARMIAIAARDYGLVPSDQTHNAVGVRFENYVRPNWPWPGTQNPYTDPAGLNLFRCPTAATSKCWFAHYGIMQGFPWDKLVVVN